MHILHAGYGVGSFLVLQIVTPFLSQRVAETSSIFYIRNCLNESNVITSGNMTTEMITESSTVAPPEDNHFEYGYLIVMAINLVVAGIFFTLFWLGKQSPDNDSIDADPEIDEEESLGGIFNLNSCSPGHPWYAGILFCLLFAWFYIAVGGQMLFANYLYSYTRDLLCITKAEAANIQSMFWIGLTAGRTAAFFFAMFIPMKVLIFLEAGGNLFSALMLYFHPTNITVIWVFSCVSGFFVGPLAPTGIAWANRYITMTGIAYTITLIGGAMAGVSFTVAIGWFFEYSGPEPMLYFAIGYSALACALAVSMHLVARTRGDKYERGEAPAEEMEIQTLGLVYSNSLLAGRTHSSKFSSINNI